jgi:hypothetical protein
MYAQQIFNVTQQNNAARKRLIKFFQVPRTLAGIIKQSMGVGTE